MLTPNWFFVGVLSQPYATTSHGNPVFLDGLSFAGMITLQTCADSWPATAGLTDETISVRDAYARSTDMTTVEAPETAVEYN